MHPVTPERRIDLLDQQIAEAKDGRPDDFEQWRNNTEVVIRRVMGDPSPTLAQFGQVSYSPAVYFSGMGDTSGYRVAGVRRAIALLQAAKLEVELETEASQAIADVRGIGQKEQGQLVFVVHGHDAARKHEVARVIRELTGNDPVILHEQADVGQVLIEKFEANAARAGFAVVLMTADDLGRAKADDTEAPRARQNVVFEMGYFYGSIGRHRVAVLIDEGVEQVGDIVGVVYTALDDAGGWKSRLATNMEAAGLEVDWSALGRT